MEELKKEFDNFDIIRWQWIEQNFVSKAIHKSQLSELKAENEKLKIKLNNLQEKSIQKELADCQYLLFGIAERLNFSLLSNQPKENI